jgi:cysteine desulfurase
MKAYFDHNSTTPILEDVKEKIRENLYLFGNPSSIHQYGTEIKRKIDIARKEFASSINKKTNDFFFTSSTTESNNTVLKGILLKNLSTTKKKHIITSSIEHPSIINTCKYLETKGVEITYLPVDSEGIVDIDELRKSIKPHTNLISIMYANNEIGTIQPISEIGKIAKEHQIPFHSDAVQVFMKMDIDMDRDLIDFLTVGGHKIGAPKGIGALFFNNFQIAKIDPLIFGGYQENNLRAGTENTIHILAFAEATKSLKKNHETRIKKMKFLTQKLKDGIESEISDFKFNGTNQSTKRLPNTLNYTIYGVEGQSLLLQLDSVGIAVSTGSACSSSNSDASYVLKAIGRTDEEAYSSIRISTGWETTEQEIDYFIEKIPIIINQLRKMV